MDSEDREVSEMKSLVETLESQLRSKTDEIKCERIKFLEFVEAEADIKLQYEEHIQMLNKRIEQSNKEYKDCCAELKSVKEIKASIGMKGYAVKELVRSKEMLKETKDQLQKQIETEREITIELQKKTVILMEEIYKLKEKQKQLTQQVQDRTIECETLEQERLIHKKESEKIIKLIETQQIQAQDGEKELRKELLSLQVKNSELDARNSKLKTQIASLKEQHKIELTVRSRQIDSANFEIKRLQSSRMSLQQNIEMLEEELQLVKSNTPLPSTQFTRRKYLDRPTSYEDDLEEPGTDNDDLCSLLDTDCESTPLSSFSSKQQLNLKNISSSDSICDTNVDNNSIVNKLRLTMKTSESTMTKAYQKSSFSLFKKISIVVAILVFLILSPFIRLIYTDDKISTSDVSILEATNRLDDNGLGTSSSQQFVPVRSFENISKAKIDFVGSAISPSTSMSLSRKVSELVSSRLGDLSFRVNQLLYSPPMAHKADVVKNHLRRVSSVDSKSVGSLSVGRYLGLVVSDTISSTTASEKATPISAQKATKSSVLKTSTKHVTSSQRRAIARAANKTRKLLSRGDLL